MKSANRLAALTIVMSLGMSLAPASAAPVPTAVCKTKARVPVETVYSGRPGLKLQSSVECNIAGTNIPALMPKLRHNHLAFREVKVPRKVLGIQVGWKKEWKPYGLPFPIPPKDTHYNRADVTSVTTYPLPRGCYRWRLHSSTEITYEPRYDYITPGRVTFVKSDPSHQMCED